MASAKAAKFPSAPLIVRINRAAWTNGMTVSEWCRWRGGEEGYKEYTRIAKTDVIPDVKVDKVCTIFGWHPTEIYGSEW